MPEQIENKTNGHERAKLPRRDWILLPLIGLLTIGCLVKGSEKAARHIFHGETAFNCLIQKASQEGEFAPPNSVCRDKSFESPTITYRFNDCGHRDEASCAYKAEGVYRIVMIGSSVAMGHRVPIDQTFATLTSARLSQMTGRPVEIYNEGMVTAHPPRMPYRFHEALTAHPDLILWALSPTDIERALPSEPSAITYSEDHSTKTFARIRDRFSKKPLGDAVEELWGRLLANFDQTPEGTLLLHLFYQNDTQFRKSLYAAGDANGYLAEQWTTVWRDRLYSFDHEFAAVSNQSRQAGVPIVVCLIPSRGQAAMISYGNWPDGFDPYLLDRTLKQIVTDRGGTYLDFLADYRQIPDAAQGYYPVDGHPDADGHRIISELLAKGLTNGEIPALRAASTAPSALQLGR